MALEKGLKEFLHRLVDRAGVSEMHTEIDAIDSGDKPVDTEETPVNTTTDTGEEEAPNAAE